VRLTGWLLSARALKNTVVASSAQKWSRRLSLPAEAGADSASACRTPEHPRRVPCFQPLLQCAAVAGALAGLGFFVFSFVLLVNSFQRIALVRVFQICR